MSEEKQVFEVLDEVKSLGEIITRCIEKGEMDNKLVANWTFDTLQLVGKIGKLVEEVEERLDLLEEEVEKKKFKFDIPNLFYFFYKKRGFSTLIIKIC